MNKLPTPACLGVLTFLSFSVQAQIVNPALSASLERDVTLPQRDVRRLLNEAQRSDLTEQEREIRRQAKEAAEKALSASESQKFGDGIRFFLSSVHFTPSLILTDKETLEAVKPFVGTVVTGKELTAMLEAVNRLYRQKGYVVCQAVLQPQRISKGVLTITLVEGKTGAVSLSSAVEGKEFKTRGGYILRAFDLEKGKVSNYREMLGDLVKFNMTNDIQLSVDMRAGQEPGTTDYEIFVQEPDPRTFTLFSDSSGSKSSGRYRGGVSFTERSLLGWRDRLQLIGVFSHGSRSFMGSYSVPLNSFGTRLTASYSYGRVKVVDGPSEDFDVKGHSQYLSLRLDHPLYVTSTSKLTGYLQAARQTSETEMFNVLTVSDTSVKSLTAGLEQLWLKEGMTLYANGQYIESWLKDYTFDNASRYRRLTGYLTWDHRLWKNWGYTVNAGAQRYLGGGEMASGDSFYLGTSSGVRGYENDTISAYNGAWINLEAKYHLDGKGSNVFAFLDAGRLSGDSPYKDKSLGSVGIGASWRPVDWLMSSATISFPFKRNVGSEHVSKARFDFVINAVW